MSFVLPIDATNSWSRRQVTLDGEEFFLSLAWNTRDSRWYLSVADADGADIVTSIAVIVDFPLLRRFGNHRLPAGWLIAVDTSGAGEEIAEQEDLGVRVQLMYLSAAEVEALT